MIQTNGSVRMQVRIQLDALAQEDYRLFQSRLVPGITGILGVRTPDLRRLGKKIKQEEKWQEYIEEVSAAWKEKGQGEQGVLYEEMLLWALCICNGCEDWETARTYAKSFIPAVNNWAVCDLFCCSFKQALRWKEEAWDFLEPYFQSEEEYGLRFAVVLSMTCFKEPEDLERVLPYLDQVRHEGYYVKMAVAWAVSIYFVYFPERMMKYLKESSLDDWTYNKALQKIRESDRVDRQTKEEILLMKRPGGTKGGRGRGAVLLD